MSTNDALILRTAKSIRFEHTQPGSSDQPVVLKNDAGVFNVLGNGLDITNVNHSAQIRVDSTGKILINNIPILEKIEALEQTINTLVASP